MRGPRRPAFPPGRSARRLARDRPRHRRLLRYRGGGGRGGAGRPRVRGRQRAPPDALIGLDLLAALGAQVFPVTDADGTSDPARAAEHIAPLLRLGRVQQVLVCGANRLIDLAVRLAAPYQIDVQVSLEAHMACGIGYCHGCSHGAVGESEEARWFVGRARFSGDAAARAAHRPAAAGTPPMANS